MRRRKFQRIILKPVTIVPGRVDPSLDLDDRPCRSCVGCKFLFLKDEGYSNYTVEETLVHCALGMNPNIAKAEEVSKPYDWTLNPAEDNWPKTNTSRCVYYEFTDKDMIRIDVDKEVELSKETDDDEVIEAIVTYLPYRDDRL